MPRRYRIETFSGDIVDVEVKDLDKNRVAVRLIGDNEELEIIFRKKIDDNTIIVEINGETYKVKASEAGIFINDENALINKIVELIPLAGASGAGKAAGKVVARPGEIRAPLSGKVIDIKVKPGDKVTAGDVVALIESMKMVTMIRSDVDGIVEEVRVEPGKAVTKNTLLIRIKPFEAEKEEKKK